MRRLVSASTLFALVLLAPATAWAQALDFKWTGLWALPMFVGDALLMLGIGYGLAAPGWNKLGIALWLLAISAGGSLLVFGLPYAFQGSLWQVPAFAFGACVFAVAGEVARRRLDG